MNFFPYSEGLSETFKNICKRYGIQVHFKNGKTIKDELLAPKDQDHITKKSGIIYRYKYHRLECDEEYIGETARTHTPDEARSGGLAKACVPGKNYLERGLKII